MTKPVTTCPTEDDLRQLLEGELDEPLSGQLFDHLKGCEQCAASFESLGSQWSLNHLADDTASVAGDRTLNLRDRLAAATPELTAGGGESAALPRGLPFIPGIVDLEAIGRGGMGVVYRGRDVSLDRQVAVKVLWSGVPLSDAARGRAEREALLLARLDHPNVVAVHAAGETNGTPYLVMEWVRGPTLQKKIDAGLPTPRQAARLARDLALALEQVHALGIIHRDIKPDNILLAGGDASWDSCTPKLADFGLARVEEATQQFTQAESVLGTPAYMAPEQTGLGENLGEVGPAADIHGLGGVAFAMLTGHAPYEAKTVTASLQRATRGEVLHSKQFSRLPADLRTIVEKCLQPDPARRYRSAGELADDFSRFLEGLPVAARSITRLERTVKWARRRPVAALGATLTVAFAIAAIGGTAYHVVELQRANEQISRSRDEAERNRDEAEAAISVAGRSMERLTGAAIKRMLLRGEALDAGDQDFLRQVADEFRNWPLGSDPVTALQFRLTGLRRIAGLFFDVGQYADALACQQSELVVLNDLAERLPDDMQVLRGRLDAHYRMRFSLYHLHRAEEAVASARESIRLLKAAPADLPRRDRDLADTTMYLAAFLSEQQRFAEAAPLFDESIAELRQLRERLPDDISLAAQQLNILYSAQLCAYNAGQQELRLNWLDQLVAAGEAALKQFPPQAETVGQHAELIKLLGIGLSQQVTLARDAGRLDEAAELAKRREQLAADFVATLPPTAIDPVHRELIDARIQLADMLRQREQPAASDAALSEARAVADRLVAEQPAIWDHARLLGRVLHQQGLIAAAAGDAAAATAIFQQEIALLTPWLEHAGRSNDAANFIDAAKEAVASIDAAKTLAAD